MSAAIVTSEGQTPSPAYKPTNQGEFFNMTPEDNNPQEQALTAVVRRFVLGVVLGLIPVLLHLFSSGALDDLTWNATKISFLASVSLVCGVLSAIFGKRFLNVLRGILETGAF
jgi:hypothetical protein